MSDAQIKDRAGGGFSPEESMNTSTGQSGVFSPGRVPSAEQNWSQAVGGVYDKAQALFGEVNALANRLRTAGAVADRKDNLPAGGLRILQILDQHGPQTVPEIARNRGSSRQNIQTLVNRLASEGCVELTSNPAHKRSALVRCTDRGKALLSVVNDRETKFLEGLIPHLPEAGLVSATALLRQIRHWLAGKEWPSGKVVRGRVVRKRARAAQRGTRRRKGSSGAAEPEQRPGAPEGSALEEGEFPIKLL
jgi:DNA-binding MarR family transcriptional regulator